MRRKSDVEVVNTLDGDLSSGDDTSPEGSLHDRTHRNLQRRHVHLIGIGGSIGTALFVQIGSALTKGGPGSLVVAYTLWCTVILAINNCLAEMVTWIPISSPFVRYADRFVDPALGFCAGINFFVFQAFLVPFEITAFNLVLHFWTDKVPVVAVIVSVLTLYVTLNIFAVKFYGEAEFWLSLGKVILCIGLICFTFVTMVGGNPLHDVYGFRNFDPSKVHGTPFAEYIKTGSLGRFMGFIACLSQASFTVVGPEYVSMTAGEVANPRQVLPHAFNSVLYRLVAFFVLGALCVGIVVPYNDEHLRSAISNARPGAGASPYVIAMERMRIPVLPHIVNLLILLSVFSAGNTFVYCASRTLYGLALEGKMPQVLTKCTRTGVPIYCVAVTISVALLSFLQVSNNSAKVLQWFVALVTASQVLSFSITSFTYIYFYRAMRAQGIPRESLPRCTFWQPFCAYYALIGTLAMALVSGYEVFLPGRWSVPTFFFSYAMVGILPVLYVLWKVIHRKKVTSEKMTFFEEERAEIDAYESTYVEPPATSSVARIIQKLF